MLKKFTCESFSSSLADSPAAIRVLTTAENACAVVEVGLEVVDVEKVATSTSVEQIKRVQGDLGSFSIIGHRIGVSGVGQLSMLYNGQFLLVE